MAITTTNQDGSVLATRVPGTKRLVNALVTFDTSYVTGGYVLTPSLVGLTFIDSVNVGGASVVNGKPVSAIRSAGGVWSLKVFSAIGTEVAGAASLAGDSVPVEVYGS